MDCYFIVSILSSLHYSFLIYGSLFNDSMADERSNRTILDSEIQIPWQDDFDLGGGIDALSGKTKHRAFEDIAPLKPTEEGHVFVSGANIIHSLHEQRSDARVDMSATINLSSPATIGAKLDYKQLRTFSSSALFEEHWIDGKYDFEHAALHDLKLTDAAQKVVEDPEIFREQYGDYFICGFQRRYSVRAIVKYQAKSDKNIQDIEGSAEARVESLFDVGAGAGSGWSTEKHSDVETVHVRHSGCDAILPMIPSSIDIKDAMKYARDVKAPDHSARPGKRQIALLKHYSHIVPSLPREVAISRDVFAQVHDMNDTCTNLELNCEHPAINPQGLEYQLALDTIILFKKGRETFIRDAGARDKAYHALLDAKTAVEPCLRLYDYLRTVNRLLSKERPPGLHRAVKDTRANAKWEYGWRGEVVNANVDPEAQVMSVRFDNGLDGEMCLLKAKPATNICNVLSNQARGDFSFTGPHTRPQKAAPPNEYASGREKTIVGFSLSCDNARGTAVEFVIRKGGILSSSLMVDVKARRGCEWHCRIFFVSDELGRLASRVEGVIF